MHCEGLAEEMDWKDVPKAGAAKPFMAGGVPTGAGKIEA